MTSSPFSRYCQLWKHFDQEFNSAYQFCGKKFWSLKRQESSKSCRHAHCGALWKSWFWRCVFGLIKLSKEVYARYIIWTASSEFGTYRLCEQRRFRRACASAQSRQNLRCSLIQAVSQEEPSDRKPDPWPLWMAGHAQLKFVMTECSKTQIRLTGLI